jgi:hypothetical protein
MHECNHESPLFDLWISHAHSGYQKVASANVLYNAFIFVSYAAKISQQALISWSTTSSASGSPSHVCLNFRAAFKA